MKKNRPIKIHRAKVENGEIILERNLIQEWRIRPEDIQRISLVEQSSMLDEIGLFLETDAVFCITDAFEGFIEIANFMKFDELFGDRWYARAEAGEVMTWERA